MSSSKQALNDRKPTTKQRPPQAELPSPETLAQQLDLATVIQRARHEPGTLTPGHAQHLQGTVGNRAVVQLLSAQHQVIQRDIPEDLTWQGKHRGLKALLYQRRRSAEVTAMFTALRGWHSVKEDLNVRVRFDALMTLLRSIRTWLATKTEQWKDAHTEMIKAVGNLRKSVINELAPYLDQVGYDEHREFLREVETSADEAGWDITRHTGSGEPALTRGLEKEHRAFGSGGDVRPKASLIGHSQGEERTHFVFSKGAGPCVIIMMRAQVHQGHRAVGAIHRAPDSWKSGDGYKSVAEWQAIISQLQEAVQRILRGMPIVRSEFYVAGGQDDPNPMVRQAVEGSVKSYARLRAAFAAENIEPKGWSVPITIAGQGYIDARIGPETVSIEMVESAL